MLNHPGFKKGMAHFVACYSQTELLPAQGEWVESKTTLYDKYKEL